MIVKIQSDFVELDKAINAHIQRKLNLALSRMEPYITRIDMSLSDVFEPAGSKGEASATQCCLQIYIDHLPAIEVIDIQTDLYCAIDRVIQKASRTMSRKLFSSGIKKTTIN